MFSMKNISPQKLSFITALALAIPTGVLIWLFVKNWYWGIGSFAVMLGGGYFLISFMLETFIYRKIKLIYKLINQTKATHKEETYYKYILPPKGLDEVTEDVEAWAEENKQEIELLRQNEKFRKEFLQNLSHEFKTPIFAIQGYIDTLLEGAMKDPATNKKFLEKASRNVERLTNLIKDLDVISRLERGELVLSRTSFVIQDVVRDVYDHLAGKAEAKQIHCSIKKGCESPIMVRADKEKIRQVIGNLVENSIRYGKTGGSIVASMYITDGRHVLVEISDDGIGIPERHLSRIFERFYRTEEGRRLDVAGSGLGLAICKHIIEAHGQSIHVRSTENVGTTVGFTLEKF
jgi:two-component system phosphate regulon sensor histidine kinase PhoR